MTAILDLPDLVAGLPAAARERVERLFAIDIAVGETDPPPQMHAWLAEQFGSIEAVRQQRIARVTNRWTLEGALFSPLRARRPHDRNDDNGAAQPYGEVPADDPFCRPETGTPADTWGRVRNAHAVSSANVAKYDGHAGVLVLRNHDPLAFDEATVIDILHLGREWAERSRASDPEAWAYLLIWNCGPRAGGSIVHGHAQTLLGRNRHYPQVERRRRDATTYAEATGGTYVTDLVAAHRDLGLVIAEAGGVTTFASLTPVKEHELVVIGPPGMDEREPAFAEVVARTVVAYRDALEVKAFNLALHRPPIDSAVASSNGWPEMGPTVHVVDRGDPDSTSSDIGAMELYAASVVSGDPFDLAARMRAAID